MIEYKPYKYTRLIRSVIVSVCIFFSAVVYAQKAETAQSALIDDVPAETPLTDTTAEVPPAQSYQITVVNYNIKGLTQKYPLSQAVPIDIGRIFDSEEVMLRYLNDLDLKTFGLFSQFKSIRSTAPRITKQ